MAEKTEKATPKKLRDARKKGQVAKSQDFPAAFTFVVSLTAVVFLSGYLYEQLAGFMVAAFRSINADLDMAHEAPGFIAKSIDTIFNCSLPILILTVSVGLLVSMIVVGPMFSPEAMKPDIKRLNPVENIKNMFKFKTLFEVLKSCIKIAGALVIIYLIVKERLPDVIATAGMPILGILAIFSAILLEVAMKVGILFLAIAIFDLVYQKHNFSKQMKMEKFEVKQEYKDTEGDPHIKGKRRQRSQEIAYQEGPASVRKARAVITNPIHIAVAISYEAATEPAPRIVTMGQGPVAEAIIRSAQQFNVPIMRNVPLAQTLYQKGKISDYIPEETYQAVAEILKWLEQLESAEGISKELFQ